MATFPFRFIEFQVKKDEDNCECSYKVTRWPGAAG
jgi:hypothetical protein